MENRQTIYFDINRELIVDNTPVEIKTLSENFDYLKEELGKVVGLPPVVSITPSVSTYVGPNSIYADRIYMDAGADYLYIHGITMPNDGLVYLMIAKQGQWERAPFISEIKRGSGPNGLAPLDFKILGYRTAENHTGYAAFDDI
jgi:hypothetical protein